MEDFALSLIFKPVDPGPFTVPFPLGFFFAHFGSPHLFPADESLCRFLWALHRNSAPTTIFLKTPPCFLPHPAPDPLLRGRSSVKTFFGFLFVLRSVSLQWLVPFFRPFLLPLSGTPVLSLTTFLKLGLGYTQRLA